MADRPRRRSVGRTSPPKQTAKRQKKSEAPHLEDRFAVTLGGVVLVNAMYFDDVWSAEDAVKRALREAGPIFVGIALDGREARQVLDRLHDVTSELAAMVLGERQTRSLRR